MPTWFGSYLFSCQSFKYILILALNLGDSCFFTKKHKVFTYFTWRFICEFFKKHDSMARSLVLSYICYRSEAQWECFVLIERFSNINHFTTALNVSVHIAGKKNIRAIHQQTSIATYKCKCNNGKQWDSLNTNSHAIYFFFMLKTIYTFYFCP